MISRRSTRLPVLLLFALTTAPLSAQTLPAAQATAFDRGDRESRAVVQQVKCARLVGAARSEQRLTAVDSVRGATECLVSGTHFIFASVAPDSLLEHVTGFAAYDLTSRSAPGRVDTAGVLAIARAEQMAIERAAPAFDSLQRGFAPMAFRFDGDSIEVWVIPVAVLTGVPTSVGGERGYIYAPDGRRVVRTVDHIAEYRAAPVADSGMVNIISTEPGVPTLSEFYLANQLNALGRSVAIVMPGLTSTLVTQNGATAWVQMGRAGP